LAKLETKHIDKDCIVVPVPDSAKAPEMLMRMSRDAVREALSGTVCRENFIESGSRKDKVRKQIYLIKEVLRGKKVFLVDDSIVRGSTSIELVHALKEQEPGKFICG